jgi:hypothetical protein
LFEAKVETEILAEGKGDVGRLLRLETNAPDRDGIRSADFKPLDEVSAVISTVDIDRESRGAIHYENPRGWESSSGFVGDDSANRGRRHALRL